MLNVLVVGPDSLSGDLGPTVLGRPDIERIHVSHPASALEVADRVRASLVLIDLPAHEAVELVRALRARASTRPCAIAWLDRCDEPDLHAPLAEAGVSAIVRLPIDPLLWDSRLEALLTVPARRAQRIPARLRDWSSLVHGTDELEAVLLNLGFRGALVQCERPLELGCKVGLSFRLPGEEDREVALVGQVVRHEAGESGWFRSGVEFLIYRGDARERIAEYVDAEPAPGRHGPPLAAVPVTMRPFHEPREWEEELRASEVRKALILDSSLEAIVTIDGEGRIVEFNAPARRLFGYSRAEVLGREAAETMVPPAQRAAFRELVRRIATEGSVPGVDPHGEVQALRADGSLVPVELAVVPAWVKGSLLLTAYIHDVSDRRRARRLSEARHRATRTLTGSLSLSEAAPAVLEAILFGLECDDARLWLLEPGPEHVVLAAAAPAATSADNALARRALEVTAPVWDGPAPARPGAALAVPMRVAGQSLGALEARSKRLTSHEEGWPELLSDVASELGLFLERQRAEAELQRFARYDGLTGLPNRSFFRETLQRTIARAARQAGRLGLVFLDLDGFKAVNDGFGHVTGDLVLQAVADRLREGTRSADVIARIGGDEFVVLVQSLARPEDAALVARALIERLASPFTVERRQLQIGASAGVAVFPEDGRDAESLLRNADLAMYRAKQEGRNTYRFFTPEMSARSLERRTLLEDLRAAFDRQELELVYLPVVDRGSATVLEALVRWRHPKLGLLTPEAFLPQAEESGLVIPLGMRVLRSGARFVASLPGTSVRLGVNVSKRQLLEPHLFESVRQTLETSGLAPSRLVLDVGETTMTLEGHEVAGALERLRGLGVGLALDDFGTGAFSIARLRSLGFETVKIDRSIVAELPDSAEHALRADAMLALAGVLGLQVVAEGVERESQRQFLESRGCCAFQGSLVGPLLQPEQVPDFLARANS